MKTSNTADKSPKQHPITLEQLERLVFSARQEESSRAILQLLVKIETKGLGVADKDQELTSREREHRQLQSLTRFAGCLTAHIANPAFRLSEKGFHLYMCYKRFMNAVFMASGYRDMNHLIPQIGTVKPEGGRRITGMQDLRKLFLVTTPSSDISSFDFSQWMKDLPPALMVPIWLSFIEQEIVLGKRESENIKQLVMLYTQLPDDYELPDKLVVRVINAWMFLSYLDFRAKHQPKKYLNKLIKRWAIGKGVKPPVVEGSGSRSAEKPRLLVLSERFKSTHAMHRCYRKSIESLREHFYTVCITQSNQIDEEAKKCFDRVIELDENATLREFAGAVIRENPDIIYYPSLGMQLWTIVLAQFRFAPIQCMSLGHPATSMCENIDYIVLHHEYISEDIPVSEKVLAIDRIAHAPYPADIDFEKIRREDGAVRVAVNAKNYKINYQLIEACKQILERAEAPVEFVFFPNCKGITYEAFRQELNRYLDAVVYPGTDYATYIDRLRRCDLVLNPFPFGNTNGIADCARIGLPFVCMDGVEPHSRIDVVMSKRLGYPSVCCATTLEEYIDAAVKLADQSDLRRTIENDLIERNAAQDLYDWTEGTEVGLVEAINWAYRNHEKAEADGRKIWNLFESLEDL